MIDSITARMEKSIAEIKQLHLALDLALGANEGIQAHQSMATQRLREVVLDAADTLKALATVRPESAYDD